MAPQAQVALRDTSRGELTSVAASRGELAGVATSRRIQLQPGDLVALTDIWVLVGLFWFAKLLLNLDNSVAVFAVLTFASIVSLSPKRRRLTPSALDDTGWICVRVAICFAIAAAASILGGEEMGDARTLLTVAAVAGPALIGGRFLGYAAERSFRRRVRSKALVVGGGVIARRVVKTLEERSEYGLDVVGAVDDDPMLETSELGTRVLGGISELDDLIRSRSIDVVIVAFSAGDQVGTIDAIRAAQEQGADVWVIPRLFELGVAAPGRDHLWGLPVTRLSAPAQQRSEWLLKRCVDFVAAGFGLVVTAPIFGAVAAAVYLYDRGPVFFRQRRVGKDGKPFDMLKFRSMSVVEEDRAQTEWCSSAESRVTPIGRLIRSTSLDELPQLLNVLKGDMSLVGPRPERPHFVETFTEQHRQYSARHRVPVGVTGWSQVNGLRGDTSIEQRATFDNYYIENWSFWQDMKILIRTTAAVLRREG